MVKKLIFCISALSLLYQTHAQSWTFVKRVDVGQTITAIDIDALGKVYVGTEKGQVYSYLPDLTPDAHYSSAVFQPITNLDASNALKVFVYFADLGTFQFLDRFSAQPRTYTLADFDLSEGQFAVVGKDGTVLVVVDREIVSIHMQSSTITSRIPLPVGISYPITYFTEEALSTDSTLIRFSGSRIANQIDLPTRSLFIDQNDLLTLTQDEVLIHNKYSGRMSKVKAPQPYFKYVARHGQQYYFIKDGYVLLYTLQ